MGKASKAKPTATGWASESCVIAHSASAARVKFTPAPRKAQSSIAACRYQRNLPFLQSHEYNRTNRTNRKKIVRGRSRGSSAAPRGPEAANRQSTGPFLRCGLGQHVGCQ